MSSSNNSSKLYLAECWMRRNWAKSRIIGRCGHFSHSWERCLSLPQMFWRDCLPEMQWWILISFTGRHDQLSHWETWSTLPRMGEMIFPPKDFFGEYDHLSQSWERWSCLPMGNIIMSPSGRLDQSSHDWERRSSSPKIFWGGGSILPKGEMISSPMRGEHDHLSIGRGGGLPQIQWWIKRYITNFMGNFDQNWWLPFGLQKYLNFKNF